MATGIEAAVITLGLFPLAIKGIEFYINFTQNFKEAKHFKRTLDNFKRDLLIEKSIFGNIWYTLVARAGILIEPKMEFSPAIMEEVLSCLPPYAIKSFINGCQELNSILSELTEKFREYEQDRVCLD